MEDFNKFRVYIGFALITIIAIVVIVGPSILLDKDDAKWKKQISGKLECVDGTHTCSEWVDTETGVHYFYTRQGGFELRVNADGSPYVGRVK